MARRSYKFTEKTHSRRGIAATVIAALLLVLYAGFVYLSYKNGGQLNLYYGSVGVLAMLLSVGNLILAFQTLGEEDSFRIFPRLGMIGAGLSTICWVTTYVLGFLS